MKFQELFSERRLSRTRRTRRSLRFLPEIQGLDHRTLLSVVVAVDRTISTAHDAGTDNGLFATGGEGGTLIFSLAQGPSHGTAFVESDGYFTYTPNHHFVGQDSFTFTVTDGITSSTGTETINVTNDIPVVFDGSISTLHDAGTGDVLNGSDSDPLTFSLAQGASHGTVSISPNGNYLYLPNFHFVGQDSFTFTASDGLATSNTATITINVTNTVPTAKAVEVILLDGNDPAETGWATIPPTPDNLILTAQSLANYVDDGDGDPLTFQIFSSPSNGQVIIAADGTMTYLPDAGFSGTDSFQYVVNDGITNSTPATVSIKVNIAPTGPNVIFAGFSWKPPLIIVPPIVIAPYKPVPSTDPRIYYYNDLALAYNMGIIHWPFQGSPPSPPGPMVGYPSLIGPIKVDASSGAVPQLGRSSAAGNFYSGVVLIPFDSGVVVQNFTIGLYVDVYVIRY